MAQKNRWTVNYKYNFRKYLVFSQSLYTFRQFIKPQRGTGIELNRSFLSKTMIIRMRLFENKRESENIIVFEGQPVLLLAQQSEMSKNKTMGQ
jgi:hypothetical protein